MNEGNGYVPFSFLKDNGNRRKTDIVGANGREIA
jgi:hypothetical protein